MMDIRRVGRAFFSIRKVSAEPPEPRTCDCGYDLSRLDRARCPECGRVRFFDATPEDLGLSDAELRRLTEAQRRREEARTNEARRSDREGRRP